MKIAFVSQPWEEIQLPADGSSSIGRMTYCFAQAMAAAGHEVVVYARRGKGQVESVRDEAGVLYRRIDSGFDDVRLRPGKVLERLVGPWYPRRPLFAAGSAHRGYIRRIASDLQQQACDIVHVQNFSQFVPEIRALNPKAKIVLHMHCEWLAQLDYRMIEERLNDADLILGCSDFITRGVSRRFPAMAGRCRTVYNGADPLTCPARETEPRVLYVGRVSPEKGVHVLVDAFNRVVTRLPNARLDVVGPAGLLAHEMLVGLSDDPTVAGLQRFYGRGFRERLRRQVIRRGQDYLEEIRSILTPEAADRVDFHGFVPQDRLGAFYSRAEVFAFPSVCHEAFGLPVAEALAAGIPVVATQSGGIPEIMRGGGGRLVARNDSAALAAAIIDLLERPERAQCEAADGRDYVIRRFSWNQVSADLLGAYESLFKKRPARLPLKRSHAVHRHALPA